MMVTRFARFILFTFLFLCVPTFAIAASSSFLTGLSGSPPNALIVSGSAGSLSGSDNETVVISGIGQIKAIFWKRNTASNDMMFSATGMSGSSAPLTASGSWVTDCIKTLGVGQVTLGTNTKCNASSATFFYTAIGDLGTDMDQDTYVGTGSSHTENLNQSWTPGFMMIVSNTNNSKVWSNTSSLANAGQSCFFGSVQCAASSTITAFGAGTFDLNTNVSANGSGSTYYYLAINAAQTQIHVTGSTRSGTGSGATVNLGVAYTPLFIMNHEDSNVAGWFRFGAESGDASFKGSAAEATGGITSVSSGSYNVGTATDSNDSGTNNYMTFELGQ